jgi:hypothetical protein
MKQSKLKTAMKPHELATAARVKRRPYLSEEGAKKVRFNALKHGAFSKLLKEMDIAKCSTCWYKDVCEFYNPDNERCGLRGERLRVFVQSGIEPLNLLKLQIVDAWADLENAKKFHSKGVIYFRKILKELIDVYLKYEMGAKSNVSVERKVNLNILASKISRMVKDAKKGMTTKEIIETHAVKEG